MDIACTHSNLKISLKASRKPFKDFQLLFLLSQIWRTLNLDFMASNVKEGNRELPAVPVPICSAGSPMTPTGLGFPDGRLSAKTRTFPGKLGWLDTLATRPLGHMGQITFFSNRTKWIASLWDYIMHRPEHATPMAQCLAWVSAPLHTPLRDGAHCYSSPTDPPPVDPTHSPYGIHRCCFSFYGVHYDSLKYTAITWHWERMCNTRIFPTGGLLF